MGELGNGIYLVTNFDGVEDVADYFGASPTYGPHGVLYDKAEREFKITREKRPGGAHTPWGSLDVDTWISIDPFRRAVNANEDLVAEETAIVVKCITDQTRIRAGYYRYEDIALAIWRWDGTGLVLTSEPLVWSRPEAKVLRRSLTHAGIDYEIKNVDPATADGLGLDAWDPIAKKWATLGYWQRTEGWELFGRILAVGSVLSVATGLAQERYSEEIAVELPTLQAFVRDLVEEAETDPERLEATRSGAVALGVG